MPPACIDGRNSRNGVQESISSMQDSARTDWDRYVTGHRSGCLYHLAAWADVIKNSYSHDTDYLVVSRNHSGTSVSTQYDRKSGNECTGNRDREVSGILPIVHMRHRFFGNILVSMPFCDAGGVLAADRVSEQMLVEHALKVAGERQVPVVDLRQYHPLSCIDDSQFAFEDAISGLRRVQTVPGWHVSRATDNSKVRLLLSLPESADQLMQSFDGKLRSQIRKPKKNGLAVKVGGIELVDDFYDVFSTNMRDLGSPVHSKKFILQVLQRFAEDARIFIVYGQGKVMACSMTLGFRDVLSNPWASFLRRYSQLSPNMLLYWAMLEYACQNGFRTFDFGRSTVNEGTYRFKLQWGARPELLYWYRFTRKDRPVSNMVSDKGRMSLAVELWKRLPVSLTRVLGPLIRRYISL